MQTTTPAVPSTRFFDRAEAVREAARDELVRTLAAPAASIPPKYFYDALGSALFAAITELPEYYPTRVEAAILAERRDELARRLGPGATLIDLGAGDCSKGSALADVIAPAQYVAVDIASGFVARGLEALRRRHPDLDAIGVGTDFAESLWLPDAVRADRRVFFYPGSSIGNFDPPAARAFLSRVRARTDARGALLIGVDRVKDADVLVRAYDDALGVTAAFDLNVLRHVNRLIGSDFDVADWRHVALWNEAASRIEMHLEARHALRVRWPGGERRFVAGESIHTENAYKYAPGAFERLLGEAGFACSATWTDAEARFAVIHAVPAH
ncbi:MAG: L-histidine N(alpha)-methyltransferase [Burkholderiales bacterium]